MTSSLTKTYRLDASPGWSESLGSASTVLLLSSGARAVDVGVGEDGSDLLSVSFDSAVAARAAIFSCDLPWLTEVDSTVALRSSRTVTQSVAGYESQRQTLAGALGRSSIDPRLGPAAKCAIGFAAIEVSARTDKLNALTRSSLGPWGALAAALQTGNSQGLSRACRALWADDDQPVARALVTQFMQFRAAPREWLSALHELCLADEFGVTASSALDAVAASPSRRVWASTLRGQSRSPHLEPFRYSANLHRPIGEDHLRQILLSSAWSKTGTAMIYQPGRFRMTAQYQTLQLAFGRSMPFVYNEPFVVFETGDVERLDRTHRPGRRVDGTWALYDPAFCERLAYATAAFMKSYVADASTVPLEVVLASGVGIAASAALSDSPDVLRTINQTSCVWLPTDLLKSYKYVINAIASSDDVALAAFVEDLDPERRIYSADYLRIYAASRSLGLERTCQSLHRHGSRLGIAFVTTTMDQAFDPTDKYFAESALGNLHGVDSDGVAGLAP